jgi:hypothetical protein
MQEDAYRARLDLLLRELGEAVGLPELALDELGKACLLLDGGIEVWLEHEPMDDFFSLSHELGPRPESGRFDRWALENSFALKRMGDVFATLDPLRQRFALGRRVALGGLERAALQGAIEDFLEALGPWRAAYAEALAEPASPEAGRTEPPIHAAFGRFV